MRKRVLKDRKWAGTAPVPSVKSSTRRQSYISVSYIQKAWINPMQAPWLSGQALWPPMSPDKLILCVFLWCPWSLWLLQTYRPLFNRIPQVQAVVIFKSNGNSNASRFLKNINVYKKSKDWSCELCVFHSDRYRWKSHIHMTGKCMPKDLAVENRTH